MCLTSRCANNLTVPSKGNRTTQTPGRQRCGSVSTGSNDANESHMSIALQVVSDQEFGQIQGLWCLWPLVSALNQRLIGRQMSWNFLDKQMLLVVQNYVITDNPRIGFKKVAKGLTSHWSDSGVVTAFNWVMFVRRIGVSSLRMYRSLTPVITFAKSIHIPRRDHSNSSTFSVSFTHFASE